MTDCGSDRCDSTWNDLCSYVGSICINLSDVIGGLIKNQYRLRDKILYYDDRTTGFIECRPVYLDLSDCSLTQTPTDNTIPIGSYVGDGYTHPSSEIICANIGLTETGDTATSCQGIDSDFNPTSEADETVGYLLENASSGCTKVLMYCPCTPPLVGRVATTTTDFTIDNDGTRVPYPTVNVTIPFDGLWLVTHNVVIDEQDSVMATIRSYVNMSPVATETLGYDQHSHGGIASQSMKQVRAYCLDEGQNISLEVIAYDNANAVGMQTRFRQASLRAVYLGECP